GRPGTGPRRDPGRRGRRAVVGPAAGAAPAGAGGAVAPRLAPPLRPRGAAGPGPGRSLLRPAHRGGQGRAVLAQRRALHPAPGPGPGLLPRRPADRGERRGPAPRPRPREGDGVQRRAEAPEGRGPALALLGRCPRLSRLVGDAELLRVHARGRTPPRRRVDRDRAARPRPPV